jgi:hypothetical protein
MARVGYELVALNKDGEERAYVRFDEGESWGVYELFDLIEGWKDADLDRRVVIRPFPNASLPKPPTT